MPGRKQPVRGIIEDEGGAAAVEFGLIVGVFLTLLLGIMDLGHAFFQWNAASKALVMGVRLSAVSNPVSADLAALFRFNAEAFDPAAPAIAFSRTCNGATRSCTNGGRFDQNALNTLVFGRGNGACQAEPSRGAGMCNLFARIEPRHVRIDYTGVTAGPTTGPRGTARISLQGLNYDFIVLNTLLGFAPIPMTGLSATATVEDLAGT